MPPDINSVITKLTDALEEAYAVAGTPSPMQQLVAANATIGTLTTANTALQAKIAGALLDMDAADAGDAAEDAARAAARAKLLA